MLKLDWKAKGFNPEAGPITAFSSFPSNFQAFLFGNTPPAFGTQARAKRVAANFFRGALDKF